MLVGGGAFATAIGAALAVAGHPATLLMRDEALAAELRAQRVNRRYLPDVRLPEGLGATTDLAVLDAAAVVFLAVPSHSIEATCRQHAARLQPGVRLVNLAKGLHAEGFTLDTVIARAVPQAVVAALKGPTFARPMLHGARSGMTLACADEVAAAELAALFVGSGVEVERWPSVADVECVSALKNVLAVMMGLCDAIEDSPNTRFLVLHKLIREARTLLRALGYDPDVLFTSAGFGDLLMTALNDTSRNRTLGLLLGRGFELAVTESGPVLEGRRSVRLIRARLAAKGGSPTPLVQALHEVFEGTRSPQDFFDGLTREPR